MCIYCGTSDYRKIYKNHHGPIPVDNEGRTFDVHHIDKNRSNNHPDNLIALSAEEHYRLHEKQGDKGACLRLAKRIGKTPEEISTLASEFAKERVKNGTHHFLMRADGSSLQKDRTSDPSYSNPFSRREDGSSVAKDRVVAGTHNLLTREDGSSVAKDKVVAGTHHLLTREDGSSITSDRTALGLNPFSRREDGSSVAKDRVVAGTHNLLKRDDGTSLASDMITDGTHPSLVKWCCMHCAVRGQGMAQYHRWHGANCGSLDPNRRVVIDGAVYSSVQHAATVLQRDYSVVKRQHLANKEKNKYSINLSKEPL